MSEEAYIKTAVAALESPEFEKDIMQAALDCIDAFEPCGPQCHCWTQGFAPPGFGYCRQDDEETTSAMRVGERAKWNLDMEELMS